MRPSKFRWSKVYESSEEELTAFLQSRNIQNERFAVEAGSEPLERTTDHPLRLWCAEGSLTVATEGMTIPLQPGDGLQIGAQSYVLQPGIAGFVYYVSA